MYFKEREQKKQELKGSSNESMMGMLVCRLGEVLGLGFLCSMIRNSQHFFFFFFFFICSEFCHTLK